MSASLLAAPVGLAAGSVAGAALMRWPAGESLGRPARSRCDSCDAGLSARDVIPVLGWCLRRGRCRVCAGRIDGSQPALEVLSAGLVAAVAAGAPSVVGAVLGGVGVVLLLAAALDIRHRWVPDRLTLPAAAVALPATLAITVHLGGDASVVLLHGLGVPSAVAALRTVTLRSRTGPWFGGGDVKLLPSCLAAASLVPGGAASLWSGALASAGIVATVGLATGRLGRRDSLPFVPFLGVGYAWVVVRVVTGSP